MPKPTSSRDRSKRTASKRPTSSATRATRSRASTNSQRVTASGGGKFGSARVTRDARRPSGTGARVTGGPAPSRPALPPAGRGGALARRPSSAITVPPKPNTEVNVRGSGVRTGQPGATVRGALPAGQQRALPPAGNRSPIDRFTAPSSAARQGRPGSDSVRGGGVRTGQPGPNRLALPPARSGGGGAAAAAVGKVAGAARGGFPLGTALMLPFAAADVVRQGRRTWEAFNRMVADTRAQSYSPPAAGGRGRPLSAPATPSNGNRQTASRGGTVARDRFTPRTASKPTPQGPSRTTDQPRVPSGPQRPLPAPVSGRISRGATQSAPAAQPQRSASGGKSPSEMAATDSWSINFLRQRRGLPSLSKGARPQGSGDVAQGDLGTRSQDERGYTMASLGLDDKKKRK